MGAKMKKPRPNPQFKLWMQAATTAEQNRLARAAGTSRGFLYLVSSGNRRFNPVKAAAVERASAAMHEASKGRLPLLYRTDLAEACAECEYARRCLGRAALRADFPVVAPVGNAVRAQLRRNTAKLKRLVKKQGRRK